MKLLKKRPFMRSALHRVKNTTIWLFFSIACILLLMTTSDKGLKSPEARAYAPVLEIIAKGESGGNYDAYFGNPANTSIRFTAMTVGQVLQWQIDHVASGNYSNAVGKYQIIHPTLLELVTILGIDKDELFDRELQDRLAIALIERRGSIEFANDIMSKEEFAANLSKEWAALPKITGTNPETSYYASDGVNKSNIAVHEILGSLDEMKKLSE